jgi:hypothetical protein
MSKEEAIECLEKTKITTDDFGGGLYVARNMAIEALKIDVVRCGEYKYFGNHATTMGIEFHCNHQHGMNTYDENGFCSCGERKDDAE